MKKKISIVIVFLALAFIVNAQEFKYDPTSSRYEYNGFVLNFQDLVGKFDPQTKQRFVKAFYKVYPALISDFDFKEKYEITIMIDSSLNSLSNYEGNTIRLHPKYFAQQPYDVDVLTHQLMNLLQGKIKYLSPLWLQLGISDYVRNKYGVNNAAANWSLSKPLPFEKYYFGYRTTARFLEWIEAKVTKDFVKQLTQKLNKNPYNDNIWEQLTGNSAVDLWNKYIEYPDL